MKKEPKQIKINTQKDLEYLIQRVNNGPLFSESFKFNNYDLFLSFLKTLNIDYNIFKTNYFYYDHEKNLHISESEFHYIWISTYGLVAKDTRTTNNFLNACKSQFTVVSLLFEKAIELINSEDIYDVDRYSFGYLSDFTPALFHNVLFYIEVFGKAYLSLSNVSVPHIHDINTIYLSVTKTLYDKGHNNTLLQAEIVAEFLQICKYVSTIPGGFKEENIKYDDNSQDYTVITFDPVYIKHVYDVIKMSYDFIFDYYHEHDKTMYLKTGLYQKILKKAKNEDEKRKIALSYGYMITKGNKLESER